MIIALVNKSRHYYLYFTFHTGEKTHNAMQFTYSATYYTQYLVPCLVVNIHNTNTNILNCMIVTPLYQSYNVIFYRVTTQFHSNVELHLLQDKWNGNKFELGNCKFLQKALLTEEVPQNVNCSILMDEFHSTSQNFVQMPG